MSATALTKAGPATTWRIDSAHTSVEFAVKHLMITTVRGRFGEVAGSVTIDEDRSAVPAVEVTLGAASIDTRNDQRDTHLRSADFFDAETHPTLNFTGRTVEGDQKGRFQLAGDLTIRGITKPVTLDVSFDGVARDPWGGERRSYSATATIRRSDWGLTWNQAMEAGGVLVGEDVKLSLDVQLVRGE